MDSQTKIEMIKELEDLEQKKIQDGWTEKDVDRYYYLKEYLDM